MTTKTKTETEIAAYKLSPELVRTIRIEAAQCGVWPAKVVEERMRESFERRPVQNDSIVSEA